jgi:hypothetical protein
MKLMKTGGGVILYESAGFGVILLLSAINNFLGLPRLLVGGEGAISRWRYGVMESVIILLIWTFVFSITRRLLQKVRYLEGMLRVCAWCRKVGQGDKWMSLEDYFAKDLQIGTTHGICPECRKKVEEDTEQFRRGQAPAQGKAS